MNNFSTAFSLVPVWRRAFVVFLMVALGLSGCSTGASTLKPDRTVNAVFDGTSSRVVNAREVRATRLRFRGEDITPRIAGYTRFNREKLESYRKLSTVTLSHEDSVLVRRLFASRRSYELEVHKYCAPVYGVLLTFENESQPIHVALCLRCKLLATWDGGQEINRRVIFDGMYPRLLELFQRLFPDDPDLEKF